MINAREELKNQIRNVALTTKRFITSEITEEERESQYDKTFDELLNLIERIGLDVVGEDDVDPPELKSESNSKWANVHYSNIDRNRLREGQRHTLTTILQKREERVS